MFTNTEITGNVKRASSLAHAKRLLDGRQLRLSEEKVFYRIAKLIPLGKHSCRPGIGSLAGGRGMSERTVRRVLKALVELRLIIVRRRHNGSGERLTDEIELVGLKRVHEHRSETQIPVLTSGQFGHTSYIKARVPKTPQPCEQGAWPEMAWRGVELSDPVTGEILPTVGGLH
jgi:DNA-binding transcriptional ArsR family regulator